MTVSLIDLLQNLVLKGNETAKALPLKNNIPPTSIRLKSATKNFIDAQAMALNTSSHSLISMILDGVTEMGMNMHKTRFMAQQSSLPLSTGHQITGAKILNEYDRENVSKAAQCASLLVSDIKAVAASNNPIFAELSLDIFKVATDLEQRLKRLEAISNEE